jgi:hypothetical protein
MTKAQRQNFYKQRQQFDTFNLWFSGASTALYKVVFLMVSQSYGLTYSLSTYMTAIATKPGLGWTASTTDALKYRGYYDSKVDSYCTLGVHAIESFIDYNRTG